MNHIWLSAIFVFLCATTVSAQVNNCGNGPVICTPMYGLFKEHSEEKTLLDRVYQKLILAADNDRAKLHNSRLATAVAEIRSGAADANVKFWVIAINPTTTPHVVKFYIMISRKPTESDSFWRMNVNCPIAPETCPSNNIVDDKEKAYIQVITELRSDGEIIAESEATVEPGDVKAIGIAVPDDEDGDWEDYSVALLGGAAAQRIRLDTRDVLRLGFVTR